MKIIVLDNYEDLSKAAADILLGQLKRKKDLLLCAATGNSPAGVYSLLAESYGQDPGLFDSLNIIKLDEWGGVPMNSPGTCEQDVQTHLIKPLHIDPSRCLSFNSNPEDPVAECQRIADALERRGKIDACILGLGMNGHIALNEPAEQLEPDIHVAQLSAASLGHSMVLAMDKKPSYGLTLGMKSILDSGLILMLVSGEKKKIIARDFLSGKISTRLPASFLWLHPNAICLIDRAAFDE